MSQIDEILDDYYVGEPDVKKQGKYSVTDMDAYRAKVKSKLKSLLLSEAVTLYEYSDNGYYSQRKSIPIEAIEKLFGGEE